MCKSDMNSRYRDLDDEARAVAATDDATVLSADICWAPDEQWMLVYTQDIYTGGFVDMRLLSIGWTLRRI